MASYKYTYPRVDITTTALSRPILIENVPDTLVLFAPFKADIGPLNKIVICHSLEEFESTFGAIDYSVQGQNGLNIQHWLRSGGTVYAARVGTDGDGSGNTAASAVFTTKYGKEVLRFNTKNLGKGYNSFKVQISKYTDDSMMVSIFFGSIQVERFVLNYNVLFDMRLPDNTISKFVYLEIKRIDIDFVFDPRSKKLTSDIASSLASPLTFSFKDGATEVTSQNDLIKNALTAPTGTSATETDFRKLLKDSARYPIDVILDAGFTTATKKAIWDAFNSANTDPNHIRNDVFVYYDAYEFLGSVQPSIPTSNSFYDSITAEANNEYRTSPNAHNAAIYQQFYKVKDPYINSQIFVTPSYFISTMLPYQTISLNKGYHTPIAGLSNGELSGVLYLNENPIHSEKEEWFVARVNYAERDSRQTSFMSQRTLEDDGKNSALQFINNALMTNIIVKELGVLAREYLFEYNDAITLSNLRKTLNTYISNYVASRVLEYAYIDVQQNEFSPEAIDVSINIKYTGTIEVISIDLTIE